MRNTFLSVLLWGPVLVGGLSAEPAAGAPAGIVIAPAPGALVLAGLDLRGGPPEAAPRDTASPAAKPKSAPAQAAPVDAQSPAPTPAPTTAQTTAPTAPPRSPVDQAVDAALRHERDGAGAPPDGAEMAALGSPLTAPAQHVIGTITRDSGIAAGQVASVANTPRDQAVFLVEQLLDQSGGTDKVGSRYGLAGELAVASYRRLRDIYQVLDMTAAQRQGLVSVVENALIAGGAVGQVENPDYEMIDVDPGPAADRARFERVIATQQAIARCIRPPERTGGRVYLLEIPRHGSWIGGATCHDAWTNPAIAAAPMERLPGGVPSGVTDSGSSGAPPSSQANQPAAGIGRSAGSVDVAPLSSPGSSSSGSPPSAASTRGGPPWNYVVTSGPQGPVVTRVPAPPR